MPDENVESVELIGAPATLVAPLPWARKLSIFADVVPAVCPEPIEKLSVAPAAGDSELVAALLVPSVAVRETEVPRLVDEPKLSWERLPFWIDMLIVSPLAGAVRVGSCWAKEGRPLTSSAKLKSLNKLFMLAYLLGPFYSYEAEHAPRIAGIAAFASALSKPTKPLSCMTLG